MTFWVAGAIVVGGAISAYASDSAASKQEDAANKATNASMTEAQQVRADNAPWRTAGQTALSTIADLNGTSGNTGAANYGSFNHQFNADDLKSNLAPNYQFQLEQGLGAATNAGNAAGFSGNTLKGINDYAQGYAGNAYQQAFSNYTANQTNIYNRLSNLAGLGQTANQITGTLGTQGVLNANNFATSGAAASAAGTIGVGNSISNGLGQYAGWNYLNGNSPSTASNIYNNRSYNTDPSSYGAQNGSDVGTGSVFSDARLKTDIKQIGKTDKGLPLYTYRYKAGGGTQIGVMAQDVEKVRPDAVHLDASGFRKVNLNLIREM